MTVRRKCLVCGNYLDTLFDEAKPNVKTCSNKCRQKLYRDRKRHLKNDIASRSDEYGEHELDEARLTRIRSFVKCCMRGLNPYQLPPYKGPGGLHASPKPSVFGIDT